MLSRNPDEPNSIVAHLARLFDNAQTPLAREFAIGICRRLENQRHQLYLQKTRQNSALERYILELKRHAAELTAYYKGELDTQDATFQHEKKMLECNIENKTKAIEDLLKENANLRKSRVLPVELEEYKSALKTVQAENWQLKAENFGLKAANEKLKATHEELHAEIAKLRGESSATFAESMVPTLHFQRLKREWVILKTENENLKAANVDLHADNVRLASLLHHANATHTSEVFVWEPASEDMLSRPDVDDSHDGSHATNP